MKYDLSKCSFNQPAPSAVSVAALVERSLSVAKEAVQHLSSPSIIYVFPCVTLVGVISAICLLRAGLVSVNRNPLFFFSMLWSLLV